MQITTCGTYLFRSASPSARLVFFDKSGVAPNIVGIFLAILLPVLCAASVDILLMGIHAPKVIWMLQPPVLIKLALPLLLALLTTTRFLPFLKPTVRHKHAMTKRAPPPFWHKDYSPALHPGPSVDERIGRIWN
jgi:hypothetical protein